MSGIRRARAARKSDTNEFDLHYPWFPHRHVLFSKLLCCLWARTGIRGIPGLFIVLSHLLGPRVACSFAGGSTE